MGSWVSSSTTVCWMYLSLELRKKCSSISFISSKESYSYQHGSLEHEVGACGVEQECDRGDISMNCLTPTRVERRKETYIFHRLNAGGTENVTTRKKDRPSNHRTDLVLNHRMNRILGIQRWRGGCTAVGDRPTWTNSICCSVLCGYPQNQHGRGY